MNSSLLDNPEQLPLVDAGFLPQLGPVMIVAPHQDDESLGCGGLIALLRKAEHDVFVLFTSDGTGSHPRSRQYPAPALKALREAEALEALHLLGVTADTVEFLGLQDTRVPAAGDGGFEDAVEQTRVAIGRFRPQTVFVPWRRDPHGDHRSTWQIVVAALEHMDSSIRLIEYPVWAWEATDPDDCPGADEMSGWRLDVSDVVDQKWSAIMAHRSQTTTLIDDDPTGFRLLPNVLEHFRRPWELFLEPLDD